MAEVVVTEVLVVVAVAVAVVEETAEEVSGEIVEVEVAVVGAAPRRFVYSGKNTLSFASFHLLTHHTPETPMLRWLRPMPV